MSKFTAAMESANDSLLDQLGDTVEYWPGGVEADGRDIDAIWTDGTTLEHDDPKRPGASGVAVAEVQVWSDDTRGVAEPNLKSDALVRAGRVWRVVQVIETVGGMHRLLVEWTSRAVVGSSRGRR